ncbi:hypothetical protein DL766_002498 [Monosporascus sp. MC13-8B]|uniref:Uncharacterized protein n=1 Tax=Monosporascus cannonballus TaxID=155416 RepID=A0ABY0HC83_9PEZI|nr:hypothetical protein DL762_002828 [Monosporascus cannonballus]RYO95334.1 hypothetical protein DL763_003758 [Monosporascus cannonballus]RYP35487.1 hypothetical protein DL766_002498 [Monosporascus sp. MC13-8B]
MATETAAQVGPSRLERLSAEDFETASIRSAAPSYISDAPSYRSMLPPYESSTTPAYTPTPNGRPAPLVPPSTPFTPRTTGLPPIPSTRSQNNLPDFNIFRIPTWSTTSSNPTYARVAHRRAVAASSSSSSASVEAALRNVLDRVGTPPAAGNSGTSSSSSSRVRPLEDPHLVGEEAAARARRARLTRESGDDILLREDRRWDCFLAQMRDWEERDRSWANFRREMEGGGARKKLARYIGRRR